MSSTTPELIIYGAVYGREDVTGVVRGLRKNQELTVTASNSVFGDSWPGEKKSLVIVYKYDTTDAQPQVAFKSEGYTITLKPPSLGRRARDMLDSTHLNQIENKTSMQQLTSAQLVILGAVYGLADRTDKANSLVTSNGEFSQAANNETWDDTWDGETKTLVVVYQYNGVVMVDFVTENQWMHFIASPPLTILEAAYGLANVTNKVTALVKNEALKVTANNDTFGESWDGVKKTLVVIYQFGQETPRVAYAKENDVLQFLYSAGAQYLGSTDPNVLTILGAAYGPANVTTDTQNLVQDNSLNVTAENTFPDSWSGTKKSYVVAYRYGRNAAKVKIVEATINVSITPYIPQSNAGLINFDILHDGEVFALNALNNMYVTCDSQFKLVATADSADNGSTLTVKKPSQTSPFKILSDNGFYIVVGAGNALYADASEGAATEFLLSVSRKGGLRFATAAGKYIRLYPDNTLVADAIDYLGAGTIFDIAVKVEQQLYRQKRSLEGLTDCEFAMAVFIWSLTGGFFLALGLGPFISTGTVQTGFINLVKSNPTAYNAVQTLLTLIKEGNKKSIAAVTSASLGLIGVLYHEGLLWTGFKWMLNIGKWYAITTALAKIIEIVFIPEAEVAELLASFAAWTIQTIQAGLAVGQACN